MIFHRLNFLVAIGLLLYATSIGDETLPQAEPISRSGGSEIKRSTGKSSRSDSKAMNLAAPAQIDEEAFRAEFRQQSLRLELTQCLSQWRPSPQVLMLAARLTREGRLEMVRSASDDVDLPTCAVEIVSKMAFPRAVIKMVAAAHTIYWRVDW